MRAQSLLSRVLLVVLFVPLGVMSQVLTGKVSSEGNPLIGANVVIKGTAKGAATDAEGKYRLELDPGTYEVVFSFLGMRPERRPYR